MRMLLPIILVVLGVVGGAFVGVILKPAPEPAAEDAAALGDEHAAEESAEHSVVPIEAAGDSDYFPLTSKMIAPFNRANGRPAFVAVEITLEMEPGKSEHAKKHEPKIVDAFLRVIVQFAATGAFDDHGHAPHTLRELNNEFLKAAKAVLGPEVRNVLIANLLTSNA